MPKCGHDSMTKERISLIFVLKAISLSFQTVLSFAGTAVDCAVLPSSSALVPSSETISQRYLKFLTLVSFSPPKLMSTLKFCWLLVIMFCFFRHLFIYHMLREP